jgi:methionyl-tRNA synthetase
MAGRFFITTAIDYVNGRPHLGHAYEKILADALARYHRNCGEEVYFITGVDEHGQKVQQSAQARAVAPQVFCDEMSALFVGLWETLGIKADHFVRTTDVKHKDIVRGLLQKLYDSGQIYFKEHEGFYSVRQEQFVTEKDMVDGQWPEIFGEVVATKEPNYFFKLGGYQDWLRDYVLTHEDFIFPTFRRNEVLGALEKPLNDLCISRPKNRLEWGIPLPFDENFVTYVWFDALVNYISFADGRWPADVQVIGKDIMIPAHAVYWPIMLQALGLPQPKKLVVHGWWMNRGAKMSKSTGNVVDPGPYAEKYGVDALRYFTMREMTTGMDADFTDERLEVRYNSDLANGLGNLVNRSLAMVNRYREGIVPAVAESALTELEKDLRSDAVLDEYRIGFDQFQPHLALQSVWKLVQRANQYIEETAPFKIAKDPTQTERLNVILAHLVETVRRLSILIEPVMPLISSRIQKQLALVTPQIELKLAGFGGTLVGHKVGSPEPLFPRLEPEK